jgi:hypothetical protein
VFAADTFLAWIESIGVRYFHTAVNQSLQHCKYAAARGRRYAPDVKDGVRLTSRLRFTRCEQSG